MSDLLIDTPADSAAREAALDIRRSVIVQAPAGSGKTDLLTRRYLRLLAAVDEPEEILAITFTRAATAEMRARILSDLEAAAGRRTFRPEELPRMASAREALAHAERRGWKLLEQPQRLAIETIDSLCLRIAHNRPLLARLGGHLQPAENAEPLYALAARRTLEHLGGTDAGLDQALAYLLDLRDNHLSGCEALLAKMLAVRDQWQHVIPLTRAMSEDDWDAARLRFEAPFQREVRRVLTEAHRILSSQPAIPKQLLELAHYACSQGNDRLALLAGVETLSPAMPLEHWRALCDFLLNGDGDWRRAVDKRLGFPSTTREAKQRKQGMLDLLRWLQHTPHLLPTLSAIRDLPPPAYSETQWTTLRHVCTVLRHAIAELRVVFAERNTVDFTEIAGAALEVLRESPERVIEIGGNIRHLLVDEFQDTSRRQHELLSALLAAWDSGEGRTCFLVGDPMQSIYMFRQAEVELFHHVRDHGIGPEVNRTRCEPLQLSVNFRSHAGLTEPLNGMFAAICAEGAPPGAAAISFARSTSATTESVEPSVHIHPQITRIPDDDASQEEAREAREQEAQKVLRILTRHLPLIDRARQTGAEYGVAVLVRARTHLAEIVPLLRRNKIPFRAVEIEHLADRQELLDLLALTRALLHPMDRIAWLAVLRAPWCGLTLADLHLLTGADEPASRSLSMLELIDRHQHCLSADGQQRLARTTQILRRALDLRWRQSESPSFSSWIERTWHTLGGPACIDAAACENAQVFFSLLDGVAPNELALFTNDFESQWQRLFAQPDPSVSERCGVQLMTIHKAKGLGFEVVLVPGLDRPSSSDPHPLICSLERISPWLPGETEFLVAPIGLKGEDTHPLYRWVRRQRQLRFDEERKRLFYVACTRARRELHLLGTAVAGRSGITPENADSLLTTAWPALHSNFEAAHEGKRAAPETLPMARVLPFPPLPGVLSEVAAVADPPAPLMLRRLPLDVEPLPVGTNVVVQGAFTAVAADPREFLRPEGSRYARLIGSAVHTLLQRLGAALRTTDAGSIRARAAGILRASALTGDLLASATETVTEMLRACAADPVCQWILAPHPDAQSEVAWSGWVPGESGSRLHRLRADRVFRAGAEPGRQGSDYLWVIDYKTVTPPAGDRAAWLQSERALYIPQLLAYAHTLRSLHGPAVLLRLGLYYPAIAFLDYWDPDREGVAPAAAPM